jgi:N6-adenosine-specific RNA methylase IME4
MSKKFSIIYCDPPWSYRDSCNSGNRGAVHKYSVMSLQEIVEMKPQIDTLAAENCALFMWATGPMKREAFHVLYKWGFKFRTYAFVWAKTSKGKPQPIKLAKEPDTLRMQAQIMADRLQNPLDEIKLFWGMGNWTRSNAEFVLLATRGKIKRASASVNQLVIAPPRGHSQKPPEVRDRIVKLMGDLPRVELFARDLAPNWDAWGNQIESTIQL